MSIEFENSIFKDLIEKYSEWNALQIFLESEEGGLLRIVDKNQNGLCLIRYDKNISKMDLPHTRWFRSVVWNTITNRPVSIAPPKATSTDFPYQTFNEILEAGIVCEEFLDGFMINCFRMKNDNKLYISSRSKLDATGTFYSSKSFRTLFIESYLPLLVDTDKNKEDWIQIESSALEYPKLLKEESSVYYSFLVQHTEHRIVKPNYHNKVFLIQKGTIYENGNVIIQDHFETFRNSTNLRKIPFKDENGTKLVMDWINEFMKSMMWDFQGIVLKDKLGNRWRFRSDKYLAVKSLRGNDSNPIERFSRLYTQNLTHTYLTYYFEDSPKFSYYTAIINELFKSIYFNYVEVYILKRKQLNSLTDLSKLYVPHLYALHGFYLFKLRPIYQKITIQEIQEYFMRQPWQRLAFLLKKVCI
jgi:hypothetical protein